MPKSSRERARSHREQTYRLSDEERADLEAALEEVDRGEVACEEEVAATFRGPLTPVDNLDKSR
jgi:hypothetical protein